MLDCFYLVTATGTVLAERIWQPGLGRAALASFLDHLQATDNRDSEPIFQASHHQTCIAICREDLYLLSITSQRADTLLVLEFLEHFYRILGEYFYKLTEANLKEYFDLIYQLLELSVNGGFPELVPITVLKQIVPPPSFVERVVKSITGLDAPAKPSETVLCNYPWRVLGVKHSRNEILFDCVEELRALVDQQGQTQLVTLQGALKCRSQLSGLPQVTLKLQNLHRCLHVQLHPCVNRAAFRKQKHISMVPPEGTFTLLRFTGLVKESFLALPIQLTLHRGLQRSVVRACAPRSAPRLTQLELHLHLPFTLKPLVTQVDANQGHALWHAALSKITWKLDQLQAAMPAQLDIQHQGLSSNSSLFTSSYGALEILVQATASDTSLTGVKIQDLQLVNEPYDAFRGMRSELKLDLHFFL